MRDDFAGQDYEIGYAKPPIEGKFKKGVSGNPSGRPKRAPDIGAQIMRELESKLTINESGKRKVITKYEGVAKQLVNKALAGNLAAARLLIPYYQQALDKVPEQQRIYANNSVLELLQQIRADDLTTEELLFIVKASAEKEIRAELEKSMEPKLRRSIRATLRKSMRAALEKSIRPKLEKSIRAELQETMRPELEKSIRSEIEASMKIGADSRKPGNRSKKKS